MTPLRCIFSLFWGSCGDSAGLQVCLALLNYDYVWDVIFHSNGAIRVKFHATGFINSVFHFGAARRYGNQVRENTLGTVHTHSAHYKVDLDVGGKTPWER